MGNLPKYVHISGDIPFKNSLKGGRVVSASENGGPPKVYQVAFPLKTFQREDGWSVSKKIGDLPEYIR
jgi:hypothetical protein